MALASQQSPGKGAIEIRGVGVIDSIEMKLSLGIAHAPGLVAVLDGFPSPDPQKYVDRPVLIRVAGSEPRFAKVGAVRDHGATISFFFQNLTKADVPVGSRIEFDG